MDVGIGLPNPVPNADGRALLEFARRADARGFSTLATIGRVAFPSHDDLVSLAAAAGATERIGLMTNILLAPTHDPVLLAKQAASIDRLSNGRLTLGMAVGGRPDDYEVTERSFADRGRRFDAALELMSIAWRGEPVPGASRPVVPNGSRPIPLVFGGTNDRTIDRIVRYGVGWTSGGGGLDRAAPFVERLREAWSGGGRGPTAPKLIALRYFALGERIDDGIAYLRAYYAFAGPFAEAIASSALTDPAAILGEVESFRVGGFDELILVGTVADPEQVDLLANVVLAAEG